MEKILNKISRRKALELSLIGLIATEVFIGCDKKNPVSPIQEENTENSDNLETILKFSSSKSNISPYEKSNLGIKEKEWLNDKTLNVKAYIAINGIEKIESGNYKKIGNKINLIYKSPKCEKCVTMLQTHELNYKFINLEKRDYEFDLQRIF